MKFVFQEIQKEPKYPQLRRIYRFSHDCYMFRFLDLLPFTLSLFLHYIIWYLFQTVQHIVLCSGLYFCLSLLAVQDIFPSLQCSALQCIQFLQWLGTNHFHSVPFYLHILYLHFANSHFEFFFSHFEIYTT